MTEKQLKWAYWWVRNKVRIRQVFTAILGIFAFSLVAYAGFGFLDWFFVSGVRERANLAQTIATGTPLATWRDYGAKQVVLFDSPVILSAGEGRYDIFSRATNPNDEWMVEFDYRFDAGGVSIQAKPGFLLPGETKNLHALGVKSDSRPSSPEIEITNLRWNRIDPHLARPDYRTWSVSRLDLRIVDAEYTPPDPSDMLPISRADFTIENHTAFSYYTVGFFVSLFSGQKIAGVNYVTISELRAGEQRSVEATWFNSLPNVTRVEVEPEVNILDERVYIPPGQ